MDISPSNTASYLPRTPPSRVAEERPAVQSPPPANAQASSPSPKENTPPTATQRGKNSTELSDEQRAQVSKLQGRDREVRAHEAAHLAAAGGLARGGANFSYAVGPDNRRYAVGGEVSIDTSPADSPEKTIQKAQTIQAAALAPAKPSSQDSAVAASAAQMAAQARTEISANRAQESKDASAARQAEAVESYSSTAGFSEDKEDGSSTIDLLV